MARKFELLVILAVSAVVVLGQDVDQDTIDSVFGTKDTPNEELTDLTPISGGTGAIPKCGEDPKAVGRWVCVTYFQCRNNIVVRDGKSDGANVIDIRNGEDQQSQCDHYLDVCCQDTDSDEPLPTQNPIPTLPPATPPPVTPKPVVTKPTSRPVQPPVTPPVTPVRPPVTPPVGPPVTPVQPGQYKCGIRHPEGIDFKITGNNNNEAEYGEFPWMIGVLVSNANGDLNYACGGSLIHPQVVLTGAHCVHKINPSSIIVRGGEWDTQTLKERVSHQERRVSNVEIHKDYVTKILFNDIALLFLESPFDPAENIGTVCLPTANYEFTSRNCFASGWGKDTFGKTGNYQVILKKIELPVVPSTDCQEALRTTRLGPHFTLHRTFMCAGGEAGKDTCTGDGGSPLVCPDPKNPGRYQQAGIVAWGIGCGEKQIPGVYVNVPILREWIDSKMALYGYGTQTYTE